ncbi:MAG TPA: dTMP kinase [Candidatus Dormibacteraeota bacterium]|jgi:dTMP kinase|nr:dTMP kinase [Candidatus Dormibacteraeota bacterium]
MRGFLVSFEGGEGSGKTTQAGRLVKSLEAQGLPVTAVREPGGTVLGEKVREILLDVEHHDMAAWAEANLYTAARAQLLKEVVIPRMARGDIVVADRFADSTFAYQGAGRGLEMQVLMAMQMVLKVRPDLTLLLDLDPELGLGRGDAAGGGRDRIEAEDLTFHGRVRQGYLDFARRDPDRYHVVDAAQDPEAVAAESLRVTLERAAAHGIAVAST